MVAADTTNTMITEAIGVDTSTAHPSTEARKEKTSVAAAAVATATVDAATTLACLALVAICSMEAPIWKVCRQLVDLGLDSIPLNTGDLVSLRDLISIAASALGSAPLITRGLLTLLSSPVLILTVASMGLARVNSAVVVRMAIAMAEATTMVAAKAAFLVAKVMSKMATRTTLMDKAITKVTSRIIVDPA
ncbi:hypothetical protein LPJ78_003945 [Coemansia sp. RSA 989]|nr:hypothetical protein LPJ78_003945 [Coemansia sp. RSA 989]